MGTKEKKLLSAARNNNLKNIEEALNEGASIETREESIGGYTPLLSAIYYSRQEAMEFLLQKGANPNGQQRDGGGVRPLHLLLGSNGMYEVVMLQNLALLIGKGADVNGRTKRGLTPLHSITWRSHQAGCTALLIDKGADVNARTHEGLTPLHSAISEVSGAGTLLIERGADVTARDNEGRTPLHYVVMKDHPKSENVTPPSLLRDKGADINARAKDGSTALHDAVRNGFSAHVVSLMKLGADRTVCDNKGRTPLQVADEKGDEVCKSLLQCAIVLNHSERSATATSQSSGSQGPSASARPLAAVATSQGSGSQTRRASLGLLLDQTIAKQSAEIAALKQSLSEQSRETALLKQTVTEQSHQITSLQRFQSEFMRSELTANANPAKRRRIEPLPPISTINENERRPSQMTHSVRQTSFSGALLGANSNRLFNSESTLPSMGERIEMPQSISITNERSSQMVDLESEKEIMSQRTGDVTFKGVNTLLQAHRLQSIKTEPFVSNTEGQPQQRPKSPGI